MERSEEVRLIQEFLDKPCKACGERFGPFDFQWAIVWDGEKWCMIRWVLTMPLGPYHGGSCIKPELAWRNENRKRYLQECIDELE